MKRALTPEILRNEKGFAMLESVPLIVLFVVLTSFGLGFFGMIHTAVLHSIAARAYTFETFRQRANLYYFREDGSGLSRPINFSRKQWRYHAINHESDPRDLFVATARPIAIGRSTAAEDASIETHNQQIFQLQPRNERVSVNPGWVMVGYGICMNAQCGNN
jgi:hypothetical protein